MGRQSLNELEIIHNSYAAQLKPVNRPYSGIIEREGQTGGAYRPFLSEKKEVQKVNSPYRQAGTELGHGGCHEHRKEADDDPAPDHPDRPPIGKADGVQPRDPHEDPDNGIAHRKVDGEALLEFRKAGSVLVKRPILSVYLPGR
jgi:hypothetical protein